MKTKITIILSFILLCKIGFGQDIPFPSESDALSQLKSSKSLANKLKTEYDVQSISNLSIKKDSWKGTNNSGFSLFYSSEGEKISHRIPRDMCTIGFVATTKPNSEGVNYEIPIFINYSRLVKQNLEFFVSNKWEYFNWEIGTVKINGGKKITPELKTSLVFEALNIVYESGFNAKESKVGFYLDGLKNCVQIDSVYPHPTREDFIKSPKEQSWELVLVGTFAIFEEGAKIERMQDKLTAKLELTVKQENGKWVPTYIAVRRSPYVKDEYKNQSLYYPFHEIGLKGVYKKKTVKPVPPKTKVYLEIFKTKFKEAVYALTDNETKDLAKIKWFVENGDKAIAKSIRDFFIEIDKKQLLRDKELFSISVYPQGDDKFGKVYLGVQMRLERLSAVGNKELTKQYLDAGMSKKVLREGKFYKNFSTTFTLILKNNRWFITNALEKKFEIPFN